MPFCTPRGALPATLGIDGGPCFHGTRLPTNPAHACPLPTNYRLTRLILGAKSLSTRDRTYCRPPCALAVSPVGHSGASVSVCKARTRPAGREFSVFQNFAQTLFPGLTCSGREIELGDFFASRQTRSVSFFCSRRRILMQVGVIGIGPRAHCACPVSLQPVHVRPALPLPGCRRIHLRLGRRQLHWRALPPAPIMPEPVPTPARHGSVP